VPSPCEYWIKYLATYEGLTNADINSLLLMHGYLPEQDEYISCVRNKALSVRPKGVHLDSPNGRPYLRKQRILSLVRNDAPAKRAREIVSESRLRAILEALLIADVPDVDAATHASTLSRRLVTREEVSIFRHYFWNVDALTLNQWREYLEQYQGVHGRRLKTYYGRGGQFVLWKLGQRGTMSVDDAVDLIFQESAHRFAELASYPNGQDTAMASKMWAENVFKASELLSKTDGAIRQSLENLGKVALQLGRREISSIETLPRQLGVEDADRTPNST